VTRYAATFAAVIGIAVAYAYYRDLWGLYERAQESRNTVGELRQELKDRQAQEQRLAEKVRDLDSDAVEIEATIRETENRVRSGERVYRIVDHPVPAEGPVTATPDQQKVPHKPETRSPSE
jgi:cell division protein FtsB